MFFSLAGCKEKIYDLHIISEKEVDFSKVGEEMQVEVISDGKKVSELLTLSEIEEYNSKGKRTHDSELRYNRLDEYWWEYDERGNLVERPAIN